MKIVLVAGARPNFIKIAPIMKAFSNSAVIEPFLVHTGQHYDERMSGLFFRQLNIPEPDINLGVGAGTQVSQTAQILTAFEEVLNKQRPSHVLVVGDVTSTIACGYTAVKMGIKLIHVESGLRSGDRSMPEETNRILTDAISDLLFVSEPAGIQNLVAEGVSKDRIHFVGNVMIDTLLANREVAENTKILADLKLEHGEYGVVTLHRPSNVDNFQTLERIAEAFESIQQITPLVFPLHPRTRKRIEDLGLGPKLRGMKNLHVIEPVGYLEFLKLMAHAKVILTDSGGVQEEATILRTPCITLRDNTERPVTVDVGANRLVGSDTARILHAFQLVCTGSSEQYELPELWDGKAAERITNIVEKENCG